MLQTPVASKQRGVEPATRVIAVPGRKPAATCSNGRHTPQSSRPRRRATAARRGFHAYVVPTSISCLNLCRAYIVCTDEALGTRPLATAQQPGRGGEVA